MSLIAVAQVLAMVDGILACIPMQQNKGSRQILVTRTLQQINLALRNTHALPAGLRQMGALHARKLKNIDAWLLLSMVALRVGNK